MPTKKPVVVVAEPNLGLAQSYQKLLEQAALEKNIEINVMICQTAEELISVSAFVPHIALIVLSLEIESTINPLIDAKIIYNRIRASHPVRYLWLISSQSLTEHEQEDFGFYGFLTAHPHNTQTTKEHLGVSTDDLVVNKELAMIAFREMIEDVRHLQPVSLLASVPKSRWAAQVRQSQYTGLYMQTEQEIETGIGSIMSESKMIVLGGVSGSGKSRIGDLLHKWCENLLLTKNRHEVLRVVLESLDNTVDELVKEIRWQAITETKISHLFPVIRAWTNRPPQPEEIHGIHYFFDKYLLPEDKEKQKPVFWVKMNNGYEYAIWESAILEAAALSATLEQISGMTFPIVSLSRRPAPEAIRTLFPESKAYFIIPDLAENLESQIIKIERELRRRIREREQTLFPASSDRQLNLLVDLVFLPEEVGDGEIYTNVIENPLGLPPEKLLQKVIKILGLDKA